MRVAVTGARGFVGGALCRLLVTEGCDVLPLDRRTDADPAHTGGVPIQRFDIAAGPLTGARASGAVDAVVHVAAYVSDTGPLAPARRINVGGTANVAASFPSARFVHVSSCSVYDPHRPQRMATEDEAPDAAAIRWPNAYGRTKAEAEALLRVLRPEAVVLRPHAVYGPGDTTVLPRLRKAARRGTIPLPGGGRQLHSLTHVHNLARACLLGCQPGAPAGTYNINDGAPLPLGEVIAEISRGGGSAPRIVSLPAPAMLAAAVVLQAAAAVQSRLTGHRKDPALSRYSVGHLALERTFDIGAARDLLGYQPLPTSLEGARNW